MSSAVIATNGKNLSLLMAHRALSWSTISMSNTFIGPVTISDMFTSEELALNLAQLFAAAGLGIIVAPPVGVAVMEIAGSPVPVYYIRLAISLAHLYYVHYHIPETLTMEKARPFRREDCNPFRFVKLFTEGSRPLRYLACLLFFNFFAE